jgi:transglutaminase-like putative cysteine protease
MRVIQSLGIIFLCIKASAMPADLKYPVSAISEEMKRDVNVVVRQDDRLFKILSAGKATYFVHYVVTILNEQGNKYASEVVGYDKLSRIVDFNGYAYDALGKQIKKLKNSEIYDQSAFDGFSLYSDNRLKAINLSQATYPYTIEYDYELEYNYLFAIPGMAVLPEEKVSVEHASYKLVFPPSLTPRYRTLNVSQSPINGVEGNMKTLTWKFDSMLPIKFEPLGPLHSELLPRIFSAPTAYEYSGYAGKMDSWESFGQWIAALNKDRNVLPDETKARVRELLAGKKTNEEKIQALYEYMQGRTRYVSIQLGIGGFQPFEAAVVDKTGYGDCKALSNYMVSMLNEAGIKGLYVLIRAGGREPKMATDFPSSQFNHAVVAVPNGADTLWLECTSQTNPFGYMGTFTGDRNALAITDTGAKIVHTPRYNGDVNVQSRSADVTVQLNGDARAKVVTNYKGLQYENDNLDATLNKQFDDQKKWVQENTDIPAFDVNAFAMKDNKGRIPSASVTLDLGMRKYATVSGKRVFLYPNLMSRSSFIPAKVEERKTKVVRTLAYTDVDTIKYSLPEALYPEFLPPPVKITTAFGEYESSTIVDQGKVVYIRRVKMKKGEFPPESYNELVEFYKNISKADNAKIVFLNKT